MDYEELILIRQDLAEIYEDDPDYIDNILKDETGGMNLIRRYFRNGYLFR